MKTLAILLLPVLGCSTASAPSGPPPAQDQEDDASTEDASFERDAGVSQIVPKDAGFESSVPAPSTQCGIEGNAKCKEGESCKTNEECSSSACSYKNVCVPSKSCTVHFGGDTCGFGEVGDSSTVHESCCRSLAVPGYNDPNHAGMTTYLDKYEITSGRIRAFVADVMQRTGGKPDVKGWVSSHVPSTWKSSWGSYLPSDFEGGHLTIERLLLGDPRHDGETNPGPGVIVPPTTDQIVSVGLNQQFGGQVYADVHGNNCGTFAGSYGFPTYYYPSDVQIKNGEVPRSIGQDILDVKSMNCITNVMLAAFCAWDGGQLATAEVIDFVAGSPSSRPQWVSGCGTQYDNHGNLLGNVFTGTVQVGGRCADVIDINATFDAGDALPVLGSHLNQHNYRYPHFNSTSDKSWQISAPGRLPADAVFMQGSNEPWMDLAGNLSEAALDIPNGRFALKNRGIGYGSTRSDLNVTLMPGETVLRVQRPEVKSALVGGRCMRFK